MLKKIANYNLVVILMLLFVSGCGGGGSGTQAVTVALAADKTDVKASPTDNATLTVTVRDGNGSPLEGQAIDFNVPTGTYPYLSPGLTNADGTAVIHLSHPPVGPALKSILSVTATSGGITSNEVVITFSNPPQNSAVVTLEADTAVVIANISDIVRLTATVMDENGQPIAGQEVRFNFPLGIVNRIVSVPLSYTNASGRAVGNFSPRYDRFGINQTTSITATSGGTISNAITITRMQPPS